MNPTTDAFRATRRRRITTWTLLAALLATVLAPLPAYWLADRAEAQAVQEDNNPRANYWRAVREGDAGYTAVTGRPGDEKGVLIANGGENWRALRNGPIATYGAWGLAAVVLALGAFFILRGQVKLEHGREGYTVQRWSAIDRFLHWYTAILFLVLTITGLSLLYGRAVLIPLLGKDGFALYAGLAKDLHNYLGPFFAVGLVLMLLKWVRHNMFNRTDLRWFAKAGGMIGGAHPSAGRFNGGEKAWFWLLTLAGIAVVISGLVLDFPTYGQTRADMQLAHLVHVIPALVLIIASLGHIYIGSIGTEGALEGMVSGRVDTGWAHQHHDLWYEELLAKGVEPRPVEGKSAGTAGRPHDASA